MINQGDKFRIVWMDGSTLVVTLIRIENDLWWYKTNLGEIGAVNPLSASVKMIEKVV